MDKQHLLEIREKCIDYLDGRFRKWAPGMHSMWALLARKWFNHRAGLLLREFNLIKPKYNGVKDKKDPDGNDKKTIDEFYATIRKILTCLYRLEKIEGGSGTDWYRRGCEKMINRDALEWILGLAPESSDSVLGFFGTLDGAVCRGTSPARFVYIPGNRPDRVLLVAHADTVWEGPSAYTMKNEFVEEVGIYRPNGSEPKRGLGADDRAGCAILWVLRNMGHSLLITDGEEQGRLGSRFLMEDPANRDIAEEINNTHGFAVQFDRRNASDFKCYDVGTDEFRVYVAKMTGYTEPDRSSFTDITTICRRIPGVNLSVGYYKEHTLDEYLVLEEWLHTIDVAREWLSKPLPRFLLPEAA